MLTVAALEAADSCCRLGQRVLSASVLMAPALAEAEH